MMSPYYAGGLGIPYMMGMGGLGEPLLHLQRAANTGAHCSRAESHFPSLWADSRRVRDGDGNVRNGRNGRNGWLRLPIRHDGHEPVCLYRHGELKAFRTCTIVAGPATWRAKRRRGCGLPLMTGSMALGFE
jgi:hypothetical protein